MKKLMCGVFALGLLFAGVGDLKAETAFVVVEQHNMPSFTECKDWVDMNWSDWYTNHRVRTLVDSPVFYSVSLTYPYNPEYVQQCSKIPGKTEKVTLTILIGNN